MERRWKTHVWNARRAKNGWSHFANAIRKYGPGAFSHAVLQTCETLDEANRAEREWIEKLGTMSPSGFNLCEGGGGTVGFTHSEDEVARRSARMTIAAADPAWRQERSAMAKAQWGDPEIAAKNRAAIEAARTPEVWERIRASQAEVRATPQHRAKMSASQRERWERPEEHAKMSAAQVAAKASPEYRAKASVVAKASHADPEVRQRQAVATAETWKDPMVRAKRTDAIRASRTPELAAKLSAKHKATFNTPEMKAKLVEAQRVRRSSTEDQAKRAAQKARPCSKCGGPRNAAGRCNACKSAFELRRRMCREIETLAGYVGERCTA